jgi:hypothetical protein
MALTMSESVEDFVGRLQAQSRWVPFDAPSVAARSSGGMTALLDRAVDGIKVAPSSELVPSLALVPEFTHRPTMKPLHAPDEAVRVVKRVRAARVYVHQQNAIDAPFEAIRREKAGIKRGGGSASHASVASGRGGAVALGFTTIETSDTKGHAGIQRPLREKLLVDPRAKRLKRMRTTVNHAARLLHFDAHCERNAQLWNKKFLTLTYADADGWEPGHFSAFRKSMAEWCRRRGIRLRFVWVAELQKRGALHYHVIVWLPKGKYLPFADAQGWWPHGRTNIVNAQSPIGYITKYASKATAEDAMGFPKGARICGHGGLLPEGRRHVRYWSAPIWVREALTGRADIRKTVGGYFDKFTGEFLPSPWRVEVSANGQVWAYRIDQQPLE